MQALAGKLGMLKAYNGLRLVPDYFFEGMEKLRTRYLNVALEEMQLYPLSETVKEVSETKKGITDEAAPVETTQLTAEERF